MILGPLMHFHYLNSNRPNEKPIMIRIETQTVGFIHSTSASAFMANFFLSTNM